VFNRFRIYRETLSRFSCATCSIGIGSYKALHKNGLATIPTSTSADDGQKLIDTRITCAVRCAPPDNKPSTEEKSQCSDYLINEIELLMPTARTFVALGSFAWSAIIKSLRALDNQIPTPTPKVWPWRKLYYVWVQME
jgi:uracil-DNA glycosylase